MLALTGKLTSGGSVDGTALANREPLFEDQSRLKEIAVDMIIGVDVFAESVNSHHI